MANKRQVEIYEKLNNMFLKSIIAIVVLLSFVAILIFLMYLIYKDRPWHNLVILGSIEALIALSFPIILKHFFPNNSE